MSEIFKKLEKVKSFDKRVETLLANRAAVDERDADRCMELLVEKAKYSQHYAEVVACVACLPISNKAGKMFHLAMKADEHPMQAGSAAWVLARAGFPNEAGDYWEIMVNKFCKEHPSYGAQMLAYGLLIPGKEDEAKKKIDIHQQENPDNDGDLYDAPMIENNLFLSHLF